MKDAAAADQRFVDFKVGVFRGGANQDHCAVFDPRQEGVLLGFVKTVNLVNEKERALAVEFGFFLGVGNGFANLFDTGKNRVDGDKMGACRVGDNPRQRCLAGAGRAVEDQAA